MKNHHVGLNIGLLFTAILFGFSLRKPAADGDIERGRLLYATGQNSASAPMARVFGVHRVPASQYPCALCHGKDGRGSKEAGIVVPDVRWSRLSSPVPEGSPIRPRPAYDRQRLSRLIRQGQHAAGMAIDDLMPRYEMTDMDIADLMAYLQELEGQTAPGTTESTIYMGVLGPKETRTALGPLERYIDLQNQAGGIHGRRIELVIADAGPTEVDAVEAARKLLANEPGVFCFVASMGFGASKGVREFLNAQGVPLVGPIGFVGDDDHLPLVYHLLPNLSDFGRAGVKVLARRRSTATRIGLVVGQGPEAAILSQGAMHEASQMGLPMDVEPVPLDESESRRLIERLQARGITTIFFVGGSASLDLFVTAASTQPWRPEIMAIGIFLDRVPLFPPDWLVQVPVGLGLSGHEHLDQVLGAAGISWAQDQDLGQSVMAMGALAAAQVVDAALRVAGRKLDRETFVEALNHLRELETGVMPPMRFDRVRRHGVRGAVVSTLGRNGGRGSWEWVSLY